MAYEASELQARREALGMSRKAFAEKTGIDRGTLQRVEDGDPSVRGTSVGAVAAALTRLEEEMDVDPRDALPVEAAVEVDGVVVVRLRGSPARIADTVRRIRRDAEAKGLERYSAVYASSAAIARRCCSGSPR